MINVLWTGTVYGVSVAADEVAVFGEEGVAFSWMMLTGLIRWELDKKRMNYRSQGQKCTVWDHHPSSSCTSHHPPRQFPWDRHIRHPLTSSHSCTPLCTPRHRNPVHRDSTSTRYHRSQQRNVPRRSRRTQSRQFH